MKTFQVYLAGPDVFAPNPFALGAHIKALIAPLGLIGLYPMDPEIKNIGNLSPEEIRLEIFKANVNLINKADGVLANLTPFRGPSADAGTVWEVGYAYGLGKPVQGYTTDSKTYLERCQTQNLTTTPLGTVDALGQTIENFGGNDNLMITESTPTVILPSTEAALLKAARELRYRLLAA
jgi:nucleoside 2-deoxyribosyltransferase